MTYDLWFFGRVAIGIVIMVGLIYFINWFIPRIGLEKHEREFSNTYKKVNEGKISRDEFIEARDKYNRICEKLRISRIRKEKLKK